MCLVHLTELRTPFEILVNHAYALLTMPVSKYSYLSTTQVFRSPTPDKSHNIFIRVDTTFIEFSKEFEVSAHFLQNFVFDGIYNRSMEPTTFPTESLQAPQLPITAY